LGGQPFVSKETKLTYYRISGPIDPRTLYLKMAGKSGDRWAGLRKKASREESPDTVVFGGNVEE
jgi:hypothetical protein